MKKGLDKFGAPLHPSGKSLDPIVGALSQAKLLQQLLDPVAKPVSAKSIQMSLMLEVLRNGQFLVQALRLESDSDGPSD